MPRRRTTLFALSLILLATVLSQWLPTVSTPGLEPVGCLTGCSHYPAHTTKTLRVLTFNMKHGFPLFRHQAHRLQAIGEAIKEQDVDIALLQEVPWTVGRENAAALLGQLTGLNHVYFRANGNRRAIGFEEGLAILSRYPIRQADALELRPQARIFEHRVVLHARIDTPLGPIDSYSAHLTVGDALKNLAQVRHLEQVVDLSRQGLAIIGGDFNAEPDSRQMRRLARRWIDSQAPQKPLQPAYTCCVDNRWRALAHRIDYLFITRNSLRRVEVSAAEVVFSEPVNTPGGTLWLSDHLGVLTELILSAPQTATVRD